MKKFLKLLPVLAALCLILAVVPASALKQTSDLAKPVITSATNAKTSITIKWGKVAGNVRIMV